MIVIAESPGTFAELGAFAISNELRPKLLVIADHSFQGEESFIKVGPIRWTDRDSLFGPTLWTDFRVILGIADEVKKHLQAGIREQQRDFRKVLIQDSHRHQLFLAVLTVEVFAPISTQQVSAFLQEIISSISMRDTSALLALASSLKLITRMYLDGIPLWIKSAEKRSLGRMKRITPFAIAGMRAQMLSVMQKIPSAVEALKKSLAVDHDAA